MNLSEKQKYYLEYIASIIVFILMMAAGNLVASKFNIVSYGLILFWPIWFIIIITCCTPALLKLPKFNEQKKELETKYDYMLQFTLKLEYGEFGSEAERENIHSLTHEIDSNLSKLNIGCYDGDEYGNHECSLFFFSNNPKELVSYLNAMPSSKNIFNNAKYELHQL